jgi:hypothetical protein
MSAKNPSATATAVIRETLLMRTLRLPGRGLHVHHEESRSGASAGSRAIRGVAKAIASSHRKESSKGEEFSALDRRGMPEHRQSPAVSRDFPAR